MPLWKLFRIDLKQFRFHSEFRLASFLFGTHYSKKLKILFIHPLPFCMFCITYKENKAKHQPDTRTVWQRHQDFMRQHGKEVFDTNIKIDPEKDTKYH